MLVWVTRDEPPDGPLSTALRAQGLDVLLEPVVQRRLVTDPATFLRDLGPDDWLVLTSPYAISAVAVVPAANVPRIAVVGEPSRRVAERYGMRVSLVAPDAHGQSLFARLREVARGAIVCYARSAQAEPPDPWPGVDLRSPILYETAARTFDREAVRQAAIAAVASPSAVDAMGDIDIPLASIGRTTSDAIRRHGRAPAVEASTSTFAGLAQAIADWR